MITNNIQNYFNKIDKDINIAYRIANEARKKGFDPEDEVNIPIAKDMAERVEGLISTIAPQIKGSGVSKRIHELEKQFGLLDWRVSLTVAEEIAKGKICKFSSQIEAIETGIRVGFAYITLGTVASPLEGLSSIKIKKRKDGKEYFALFYAGPVRSAGGTGAAVSVLISDYVRKKMGYSAYDATETEVKRMVTEVYDYHERISNLQYLPSENEVKFLVENLPVQIDGEPSEKIEVSNYKDLERIETNVIRNGTCLVIGECLCQKAPKLWKQLSKWGKDFDMTQWNFLEEFLKVQKKAKSGKGKVEEKDVKITPDYTFIKDLLAGRPVLTFPLRIGGFRLRLGRCRNSGYSSAAIHPATMYILNKYIAIGTQLKLERPGKATSLSSCDSVLGPIVKLKDDSVIRIDSELEAKKYQQDVKEIIFIGDILVNYGDFFNRAHSLVPLGYCNEWWVQEFEKATVDSFGTLDLEKLSALVDVPAPLLESTLKNPLKQKISGEDAIKISTRLSIPLHPDYTSYWSTISFEQLMNLLNWMDKVNIEKEGNIISKIILPLEEAGKQAIEFLGLPHLVVSNEFVVIEKDDAAALLSSLSIQDKEDIESIKRTVLENKDKDVLEIINLISKVKIRDKAGTFIGARMGRPEKAKMRLLTGSPQVLFPVGAEGGRLRSFQSALEAKKIKSDFPVFVCQKCNKETIYRICEDCGKRTKKVYYCRACGELKNTPDCKTHGEVSSYRRREIDIKHYFNNVLKKLRTSTYPDLIKGVKGTSNKEHVPEHLVKGFLRAKHGVYVNKDGTTRYDMTQLALTHFKPKEIGVEIERLKELGYEVDIQGKELQDPDQVLELFPQDIVLPLCFQSPDEGADKVLIKVAKFLDELLVKLYGLKPFYNLNSEKDLIGQLVLCLAPHTSAAMLGRIIGFSKTQAFYAHPLLHAATRRDCDGDEASVILLMDALLNFSRQFLPAHRGSVQDAPLVLTTRLIPSEVDDMVFDIDTVWKYPLEIYESALEYKVPWSVKIELFGDKLKTDNQYLGVGFTHDTGDINFGVKCSAYKVLPSMEEKLKGQMDLAEKIRAVDAPEVARFVIEKHFLKDIKGNLRKFSMQQFRCVKCNEKYRRPPLIGKCINCGGRIIFTISEGSVVKYLEPSISLATKYNVPSYLVQTLELTKRRIESVFGKDKEKQEGLGKWFG
ncbi:DNA polymerase II large subunit [Candidatus Woesearchaeota archaeon]|nr:DNA polymerase II large subunit [Candidatus Woesearchaeota archaeon]